MQISEQTNELFAALSKMQSQLESVSKSRQGHGYKYADLAGCIDAAKEPLASNGLSVTQMMGCMNGENTLITVLAHSSGQYISSEFIMEKAVLHGGAGSNPAQAMGASITYMRRYAFAAIIGLAQEDDDAKDVKARPAASQPAKKATPAARMITDAQRKHLQAFYSNRGDSREDRLASLSKWCQRGITTMNEVTFDEADGLIQAIEEHAQNG